MLASSQIWGIALLQQSKIAVDTSGAQIIGNID